MQRMRNFISKFRQLVRDCLLSKISKHDSENLSVRVGDIDGKIRRLLYFRSKGSPAAKVDFHFNIRQFSVVSKMEL